jgi:thiol-disulfide isomerase/thioredoxin
MWRALPLLILSLAACTRDSHPTLAIGAPAPDFALPGIDGKTHTLSEYSKSPVLAVVFTCNHCPTSQLYEGRIKKLDEDYRGKGLTVVAINPDSPEGVRLSDLGYSDVGDSLPEMKARATHRGFAFPYLHDNMQAVSLKFGVVATPHIFVFDAQRTLQYEGRIDDSPREPLVKTRDARNAIDALLGGQRVAVARTTAVGCPWPSKASGRAEEMAKIQAEPVALEMADADSMKKLRGNPTGKLLMVNFWATWCGPCVTEFPELETTYRMYRGRGFDFVSVSANDPEDKPQVVEFLQKNHASGRNLQFGTPDTFGLLMPAAVPFTVLIAPNGDIVFQELGEVNILKLRRAILVNLPDDATHQGQQAYWSAN